LLLPPLLELLPPLVLLLALLGFATGAVTLLRAIISCAVMLLWWIVAYVAVDEIRSTHSPSRSAR
jgi:hypothetical protein